MLSLLEEADVCVVGAGIAGLVLSEKLRRNGLRVVVLESGGRNDDSAIQELNSVVNLGQVHLGGTEGRFRRLGGTSTRWGGQLLPLVPEDFRARPHVGLPAWPIEADALAPYLPEIEELFAVDRGVYDGQPKPQSFPKGRLPLDDPDIALRFTKSPPFRRRNLARLLRHLIDCDTGLEVWLGATVTNFEIDLANGRVSGVTASSPSGQQLCVRASNIVIAAGTIESTRLLLTLDAAHHGRIFAGCEALGRYFHDHFSASAARLLAGNFGPLNRAFGQHFAGSTMRSLRLELRPSVQQAEAVASAFGYISPDADEKSTFVLLRRLLRDRQVGSSFDLEIARQLARRLPSLAITGVWRFCIRQLRWPAEAMLHVRIGIEQLPHSSNRITLSEERDWLGQPRVAIDWRLRPADFATFAAFARRFAGYWRRNQLDSLARLEWLIDPEVPDERVLALGRDTYHPAGSTRMGLNWRRSVVNPDLRTHALVNLWIASASVLPSSGSANPTLTLMLLARRLGEHLSKRRA